MIIRDTFNEKKILQQIEEQVGKPFPIIRRIRMGGTGSQRLFVLDGSPTIKDLFHADLKRDLCNLELRPGGVIVRFQSKMHTYAWTIPWQQLKLSWQDNEIRIHDHVEFISVETAYNEKLNTSFLEKVVASQSESKKRQVR